MKNLKKDFPFFSNNPDIVYCDNAATTQKPQVVIDAISNFYTYHNAPVHRGVYRLAEQATDAYEKVRGQVKDFLGAEDASEIIFIPNATAGINIVAQSWARKNLHPGDEIVLTELEHHANIVPWLQLAQEKGLKIRYIPIQDNGSLNYDILNTIITSATKLVAVTALSNVTGTEVDLERIRFRAHQVGAAMLVDACQAVSRRKFDIRHQKFDFLVFSGHKVFGPTGASVLFANRKFHSQITPVWGGGGAVLSVDYDRFSWREVPYCYEVGTPAVADVIGLGSALEYFKANATYGAIIQHEAALCARLIDGLKKFPQIKFLGPIHDLRISGHLVTFEVQGMHAADVATYLDSRGIAVRAGHHCAQPLHTRLGCISSIRVSFSLYNTLEDVDAIVKALLELF